MGRAIGSGNCSPSRTERIRKIGAHGSAVLGSLQQVAGAAGVALFIALMSANTARLAAAGTAPVEALAGGIRAAFLCGAVCALFAVACAFFVRKPATQAMPVAH